MKKQLLKSTAVTAALALALSLAACGGASSTTTQSAAASEPAAASSESTAASEAPAAEPVAVAIDKDAFDALLASGPVADDAAIEANSWAKAVKEAGVLRVGGTRTSFLFSQLDETDNSLRGFDAGLYQLLARYILGDRTGIDTAPAAPAVG